MPTTDKMNLAVLPIALLGYRKLFLDDYQDFWITLMGKPEKSGKDEMNLAVLPIALLGRNDMRFDLANKLGLAQYQYASHLKRPLSAAADELVKRGYLTHYEFLKIGKFTRMKFSRSKPALQMALFDSADETITVSESDPLAELWTAIVKRLPDDRFPQKLAGTRLLSIEHGTATIAAGDLRDWVENRLGDRILKALQREREDIAAVCFVE